MIPHLSALGPRTLLDVSQASDLMLRADKLYYRQLFCYIVDSQLVTRQILTSPDTDVIRSELNHKVSKEDYAHDMGDIKVILMRIEGKLDNWRWTLIIVLGIATLIIGYLLSRLPALP